ncbi:MAG: PKD domain-containing protein [Candidatus Riflebacteria bacterium]|nr:PKD domain-containing protein [Candidatus Riflebacteria bacterium]
MNNYGGGFVYSFGPNGVDEGGKGDDIVVYYRPPTAAVADRSPSPNSTTGTALPLLYADWGLATRMGKTTTGNELRAADVTFYVDNNKAGGAATVVQLPGSIHDAAGDRDKWRVSHQVTTRLMDGSHTVRVEILDAEKKPARAAWKFTVDTQKPVIFSMTPGPNTTLGVGPLFVSALLNDPSGINLKATRFSITGPGLTASVRSLEGVPDTSDELRYFQLSQQSVRFTPPPGVMRDGTYTASLRVADGLWQDPDKTIASERPRVTALNAEHEKTENWTFKVEDKSPPSLTILQPRYGTTVTTSDDLDSASVDTVELDVLGSSDPTQSGVRETQIELVVDPGGPRTSGPQSTDKKTAYTDDAGHFSFAKVSVGGGSGASRITSSTIWVRAVRTKQGGETLGSSSQASSGWLPTLVYVYNHPEDAVAFSAWAEPTTTEPNKAVTFYFKVDRGTAPFDYVWDFADGQQQKGIRDRLGALVSAGADPKTTGAQHAYLTTGTFNALLNIKDARGMGSSKLIPVYVGTESEIPRISVKADPFAFRYTKDPDAYIDASTATKTWFNIRIDGKFLGEWRLKVLGSREGRVWYHNKDEKDVNADGFNNTALELDRDAPHGVTWNKAASNSFRVPWTGRDNTLKDNPTDVTGTARVVVAFPGSVLDAKDSNFAHKVVLEYKDAFSVDETAATTVATSLVQVFNGAPQPGRIRIVSVRGDPYSPQLFDANNDGTPDFTNSPAVDLAIDRPVTTNTRDLWISNYPLDLRGFQPAGSTPDTKLHPSYLPATRVTTETPGGYVFMNWTLADGATFDKSDGSTGWIPLTDANLNFRDWPLLSGAERHNFPAFPTQAKPFVPGDPRTGLGWDSQGGLSLAADGAHWVHAIFRSAGPFISTELDNFPSLPFTRGVTSVSIFYDATPPEVMSPTRIVKVQVDTRTQSIIGTLEVTATDRGSGLVPRGKVLITTPDQVVPTYKPYATSFTHNFGPLAKLPATGIIQSYVQFQDNLANTSQKLTAQTTTNFSQASAALTSFTWTIIGSGNLTYFQTKDRTPVILGLSDIDSAFPFVEQWRRNAVKLPASTTFEDAFVSDGPDFLTIDNFPNPDDRLGFLYSRRPNSSTNDNEDSFAVDNQHRYYLALVKGAAEVEYRVYEVPRTVTIAPGDVTQLDRHPILARVNRVADPNFEAGRVNEGILVLPDQVASGQAGFRTKDLHGTNKLYLATEVWDKSENLLISTNPSDFATYPYKGVIKGFNSGLVAAKDYHLSSNRFRVRVGFVASQTAYSLSDILAPSARFLKGNDNKPRVLAMQTEPTSPGLAGVHPDAPFTALVDVPDRAAVGTPDLTTGTVAGTVFKVEFANYSNAFEMMTTGTVFAAVRLNFTGSQGTTVVSSFAYVASDGSLYLPAGTSQTLRTSAPDYDFTEVDGRKLKPSTFQFMQLIDVRGAPRVFSPDLTWPFLDGKVGTLTARVWYRDEKLELLAPVEASVAVDTALPTNTAGTGLPGLFLETLLPKNHVDRAADAQSWLYWPATSGWLSAGRTRWTSCLDVQVTYDAADDGDIYREHSNSLEGFYSGQSHATAVDAEHDGPANAGPDDAGRPARLKRWRLIKPKGTPKTQLMTEAFTLSAADGPKEFNFRFRDTNFNVTPAPLSSPDPGPPAAPTYLTTVYLDTTPPALDTFRYTTSPVSPKYANSLRKLRLATEANPATVFWTNDTQPRFQWKFSDPGCKGKTTDSGIGVKGVNMTLSQVGAVPPVPALWPTQHQAGAFGVDVDVSHPSSRITSCTPDGKKCLTLQAWDALANVASPVTTWVYVDTRGPVVSAPAAQLEVRNMGLTRRVIRNPTSGTLTEARGPGLKSNPDLALLPAMRVTDVRFQVVAGRLVVGNLVLKNASGVALAETLQSSQSAALTTFTPFVWQVPAGADGRHPLASGLQYDSYRPDGQPDARFYIQVSGYDATGGPGAWVAATSLTTASTSWPALDLRWREVEQVATDAAIGVGVNHTYTAGGVADALEWRYQWSGGTGGLTGGTGALSTEAADLSTPSKLGLALPANTSRQFWLAARDRLTNLGAFALLYTFRSDVSEPVPVLTLRPKVPPAVPVPPTHYTSVMTMLWNDVDDVPDPTTQKYYRLYFHHSAPASQTFVLTATMEGTLLTTQVNDTVVGDPSHVCETTHPLLPLGRDDDIYTYQMRPVDSFGTEQGHANNELSIHFDHTTPTVDPFHLEPTVTDVVAWDVRPQPLDLTRSTANLRLTTGDQVRWTNVMPVRFFWTGRDLSRFSVYRPHTEEGSGIKGYNTSFAENGAVVQPPLSFPPALPSASGQLTTRDEQAADPLATGKDGKKTFTVQAFDLVGNRSSLYTTSYQLDTSGPRITANLGTRVRRTPRELVRLSFPNRTATAAPQSQSADFGTTVAVSRVAFYCLNGAVGISDATLRLGGTDVIGGAVPPASLTSEVAAATTFNDLQEVSDPLTPVADSLRWTHADGGVQSNTGDYLVVVEGLRQTASGPGTWASTSTLAANYVTSAIGLEVLWNEINGSANDGVGRAADDGHGVGVNNVLTAQGLANAAEWQYEYRTQFRTAEPISTLGLTDCRDFLDRNESRDFLLSALDRLTNIGPRRRQFTASSDLLSPDPVDAGRSITAQDPTTRVVLTWNPPTDPGPSPASAGVLQYHVFRSHRIQAAALRGQLGVEIGSTAAATPTYADSALATNGTSDGTFYYTVVPEDAVHNWQWLGNRQRQLVYDRTTPTVDVLAWTVTPDEPPADLAVLPSRLNTGPAGVDALDWTNYRNVDFNWKSTDFARFSWIDPTDPGSRVRGINTTFSEAGLSVEPVHEAASPSKVGTDTQKVTIEGADGVKAFTVQAVDHVSHFSTRRTTTFHFDGTGPTILTTRLDLAYFDNRQTIRPGTTLPVTTITSAAEVTVRWAEIEACARDGSGVGVHRSDRGFATADAQEWRYTFALDQTLAQGLNEPSGTAESTTVTTGATQVVLPLERLAESQAAKPVASASLWMSALDRLTNIGTPVRILDVQRDNQPPNALISVTLPTPTSNVVATWQNVPDNGAAGTQLGTFRIYRSALDPMPATVNHASPGLVATTRSTSPFEAGVNRYWGTRPLSTLISSLAGVGAGDPGEDDSVYYYRIQPVDKIGNEQTQGNATIPILFDTTAPLCSRLDWQWPSAPPLGTLQTTRMTTATNGVTWTNEPLPRFHWRSEDLAVGSTVSPRSAGSGVERADCWLVDGLVPAAVTSQRSAVLTTAAPSMRSWGYQGPTTSDFVVQLPARSPAPLDRDGPKTFSARAVDRLSFAGSIVSTQFYLDTTGPVNLPTATGLRMAFFNGTPISWNQGTSVKAQPFAAISRTFPLTMAFTDLTVSLKATAGIADLRKFKLYKAGVLVATLGDLTDTTPFRTNETSDTMAQVLDLAWQTVVTPLNGSYDVSRIAFTLSNTGANPAHIKFRNVALRPASGADVMVQAAETEMSGIGTTQSFSVPGTQAAYLVYERQDQYSFLPCVNCDTDYAVQVDGTRYGHSSTNSARYSTRAAIMADSVAWEHQAPYLPGTLTPSYTLNVKGSFDQGLAAGTQTVTGATVAAGATDTNRLLTFPLMVVKRITVTGDAALQVQSLRLRVVSNGANDYEGLSSYVNLPQTVTPPSVYADKLYYDVKNTGPSAVAPVLQFDGEVPSSPTFGPPGGIAVGVGQTLPPTNALVLRVSWNPIQTSFTDGSGIGLADSQTDRWSYTWDSTASNAPQNRSVDHVDLPLPPGARCNMLYLAGRDRLTNLGPYRYMTGLSLDADPPWLSTFEVYRLDGPVTTNITSSDGTWISTNRVRYVFAGSDPSISCGGITGVQLQGFSYSFAETGGDPDIDVPPDQFNDPIVPPEGHSTGSGSVIVGAVAQARRATSL